MQQAEQSRAKYGHDAHSSHRSAAPLATDPIPSTRLHCVCHCSSAAHAYPRTVRLYCTTPLAPFLQPSSTTMPTSSSYHSVVAFVHEAYHHRL